jgi:hypothetical protein
MKDGFKGIFFIKALAFIFIFKILFLFLFLKFYFKVMIG